jgi:hypothetical protein
LPFGSLAAVSAAFLAAVLVSVAAIASILPGGGIIWPACSRAVQSARRPIMGLGSNFCFPRSVIFKMLVVNEDYHIKRRLAAIVNIYAKLVH